MLRRSRLIRDSPQGQRKLIPPRRLLAIAGFLKNPAIAAASAVKVFKAPEKAILWNSPER
jgi:hypothetical protein